MGFSGTIGDGPASLEQQIENWKETAALHLRNEERYRARAEAAEARIADLEATVIDPQAHIALSQQHAATVEALNAANARIAALEGALAEIEATEDWLSKCYGHFKAGLADCYNLSDDGDPAVEIAKHTLDTEPMPPRRKQQESSA